MKNEEMKKEPNKAELDGAELDDVAGGWSSPYGNTTESALQFKLKFDLCRFCRGYGKFQLIESIPLVTTGDIVTGKVRCGYCKNTMPFEFSLRTFSLQLHLY